MNRRAFIRAIAGLALSAAGLPLYGCRKSAPYIVGYLDRGTPGDRAMELKAFEDELAQLMSNQEMLLVKPLYGEALRALVKQLVELKANVIVTFGTDATAAAASVAGPTIPVIMASSSDPVGSGFAANLARPGGNITGLTSLAPKLTGKRLQLLREAFPQVSQIGLLRTDSGGDDKEEEVFRAAAIQMRIVPLVGRVQRSTDAPAATSISAAITALVESGATALLVAASAYIGSNRKIVVQEIRERKLPAMYAQRELVADAGGLMAYGPDYVDMHRRAAVYVYKIFKGASPGLLPIETPRRFTFVINQSAARQFGVTFSRALLAQVDEVL